ncbi:hypothetical protein Taro_039474 [Colocasia esculenta]|uniref:Uncharacterized protein n=1 Tax=Colocasia esculenta TaxID=4460 RepID=A0A843WAR9_COLES|nr:hypothetical protein [Colocasia esculenta]
MALQQGVTTSQEQLQGFESGLCIRVPAGPKSHLRVPHSLLGEKALPSEQGLLGLCRKPLRNGQHFLASGIWQQATPSSTKCRAAGSITEQQSASTRNSPAKDTNRRTLCGIDQGRSVPLPQHFCL